MFKIGDRVEVINDMRVSHGSKGRLIKKDKDELNQIIWRVRLDKNEEYGYNRELNYLPDELKLCKNQIVIDIIKDL